MTELEKEIDDMVQAKKLLIDFCVSGYDIICRDDYHAIRVLMEKCDDRAREARRKLRHINRTNNEDNQ